MRKLKLFRLSCLALSVVAASSSASTACEFGTCWGALSAGPDGRAGYATHKRTAPDAYHNARQSCGPECSAIEMFYNTCASLALDRAGNAHMGTGSDQHWAASEALELCSELGQGCVVRVSACSRM